MLGACAMLPNPGLLFGRSHAVRMFQRHYHCSAKLRESTASLFFSVAGLLPDDATAWKTVRLS
jgi:hypothetical protein